jgi:hypothetical protein
MARPPGQADQAAVRRGEPGRHGGDGGRPAGGGQRRLARRLVPRRPLRGGVVGRHRDQAARGGPGLLSGAAAPGRRARGGHQRPDRRAGLQRRPAWRAALPPRRRSPGRGPLAARAVTRLGRDAGHRLQRQGRPAARAAPPARRRARPRRRAPGPVHRRLLRGRPGGPRLGHAPAVPGPRRPDLGRPRPPVGGRDRRPAALAALAPGLPPASGAHRRGPRRRRQAPAATVSPNRAIRPPAKPSQPEQKRPPRQASPARTEAAASQAFPARTEATAPPSLPARTKTAAPPSFPSPNGSGRLAQHSAIRLRRKRRSGSVPARASASW